MATADTGFSNLVKVETRVHFSHQRSAPLFSVATFDDLYGLHLEALN